MITPAVEHHFSSIDWFVVIAYLLSMIALGAVVGRRARTTDAYMLASRRIPFWAAGLSLLATSLSAATFVGAPEASYAGNLTYLSQSIGSLIAAALVAAIFIPAFYRSGVTTVYELLEQRFGVSGRLSASAMFLVGRVFASGARLFIAGIPISIVLFGDSKAEHLIPSILVIASCAILYTMAGGIRAIIWTDTAQIVILLGAALGAVVLLMQRIDMPIGEMWASIGEASTGDGSSKLTLFDTRLDPSLPFTLWTALIGMTLLNTAAMGTDQDLAQRLLTCTSWRRAAGAVLLSNLLGVCVVSIFMAAGLLLWLFHQTSATPGAPPARDVFISFILAEAPLGMRGLVIAGVAAAAMSSLDSALGAMSSASVWDFYKRLRPTKDDAHYVFASRLGVVLWGAALAAFACVCVHWHASSDAGLLEFSLGVMTLAYGGLLGVFLTVLLTKQGNAASAGAALAAGVLTAATLQFAESLELSVQWSLAWRMTAATIVATAVCAAGRAQRAPIGASHA